LFAGLKTGAPETLSMISARGCAISIRAKDRPRIEGSNESTPGPEASEGMKHRNQVKG